METNQIERNEIEQKFALRQSDKRLFRVTFIFLIVGYAHRTMNQTLIKLAPGVALDIGDNSHKS